MSEFKEARWAVMSERGREAAGLPYAEAAALVRELKSSGVSGLCVITDEAAGRLPGAGKGNGRGGVTRKRRRASKKEGAA